MERERKKEVRRREVGRREENGTYVAKKLCSFSIVRIRFGSVPL